MLVQSLPFDDRVIRDLDVGENIYNHDFPKRIQVLRQIWELMVSCKSSAALNKWFRTNALLSWSRKRTAQRSIQSIVLRPPRPLHKKSFSLMMHNSSRNMLRTGPRLSLKVFSITINATLRSTLCLPDLWICVCQTLYPGSMSLHDRFSPKWWMNTHSLIVRQKTSFLSPNQVRSTGTAERDIPTRAQS